MTEVNDGDDIEEERNNEEAEGNPFAIMSSSLAIVFEDKEIGIFILPARIQSNVVVADAVKHLAKAEGFKD